MSESEYATCAKTFATLRIYAGDIDPDEVTDRLGVDPTSLQRRGEVILRHAGLAKVAPINGWFLESKGRVDSLDLRRHVDWVLARVGPKVAAVRSLRDEGCAMDILCYWLSRSGHGGPVVSPSQMRTMAELGLELGFDFYGPFD